MNRLILVLGMHRSGTSLLTNILSKLGIYLGDSRDIDGASESNKDGHFEHIKIRQIHDEMLLAMDKAWCSLNTRENELTPAMRELYKRKIKSILWDLFLNHDVVAIKDPRIAFFLGLWEEILEEERIDPVYLYVIRNADEVASSLYKRDGIPVDFGIKLWKVYNLKIQTFLFNKECYFVKFSDLFNRKTVDNIKAYLLLKEAVGTSVYSLAKEDYRHNYSEKLCVPVDDKCNDIYNCKLQFDEMYNLIKNAYNEGVSVQSRIKDYELISSDDYILQRKIVIYGAGDYGRRTAKMLRGLGVNDFCFCDRNPEKINSLVDNAVVRSISTIDNDKNICMIIAIANEDVIKYLQRYFTWLDKIDICSFFSLEKLWNRKCFDYGPSGMNVARRWYNEQVWRIDHIWNAMQKQILVYQNGKVGSSSLFITLAEAGIDCAQIHRNYFYKDILRELICGTELSKFAVDVSFSEITGNMRDLRGIYKGKRIITLVREPISTDFSTVFQWLGTGHLDRYLNEQYLKGYSFLDSVKNLMFRIKGRMFDWFREELFVATGINVFDYSFDRKKGYTIIENEGTQILIMQLEKLDTLSDILEEFLGLRLNFIKKSNESNSKVYSNIYKATKKDIAFDQEYIDFYYKNNKDMDHFYSKDDQGIIWQRWMEN